MVFDVWDSPEELDAFTTTLMPILAIEHIDMAPPEPLEIHDLIDGGDSRALRRTIAELRDKAFFIRPVEKLREEQPSVPGNPSEHQDPDETPQDRGDSPPEHRSAGHVAIASHVQESARHRVSPAVGSCRIGVAPRRQKRAVHEVTVSTAAGGVAHNV